MQDNERKSERGQSLVEFAVGLVMLMILLTVIVDAARALFTYLSIRDAAQESAAYASYQPGDDFAIIQRACGASNLMADLCGDTTSCSGANPTICSDLELDVTLVGTGGACSETSSGGEANGITIDIQYPAFPLTMPLVGTFTGSQTVPIGAQVTDTILAPKCP